MSPAATCCSNSRWQISDIHTCTWVNLNLCNSGSTARQQLLAAAAAAPAAHEIVGATGSIIEFGQDRN